MSKENHKLANIAMDLEINQMIDSQLLPEWGIFLDHFRNKYPEIEFKPKEGSVYYFNQLKKIKELNYEIHINAQHGDNFSGEFVDENGNPITVDEGVREIIERSLERKIEELIDSLKQAGNAPAYCDKLIKGFVKPKPVFNYHKYIKTFINNSTEYNVKKSYYKVNARFPDNPRVVLQPKSKILMLLDFSGSVGAEDEAAILNEVYHTLKSQPSELRSFDTAISEKINYRKGDQVFPRTQCGGTDFEICIDYYESRKDMTTCIVFTDGEAYTPRETRKNILWVITKGGSIEAFKNTRHQYIQMN
jgi:predicted metal-dependent peptidase